MNISNVFNHQHAVDQFYEHLTAGAIPGVQARPALSRDVHQLYGEWIKHRGWPSLGLPAFVQSLSRRHGVLGATKRYVIGDQVHGPHALLWLVPLSPPLQSFGYEREWLGQHVAAFKASLAAFKAYANASVEVEAL